MASPAANARRLQSMSGDVAVGDAVTADQTVAVVSAMKMEHKLVAGLDGTVAEVAGEVGANVDQGALLVRVEPAAAE